MSTATATGAGAGAEGEAEGVETWSERADRLGRRMLLPLLAVATLLAVLSVTTGDYQGPVALRYVIIAIAAAAVWAAAMLRYPTTGVPPRVRTAVFCVHVLLGGVLVWLNPWFGVFAFTGYFLADELSPRLRRAGFATTAGVLSASQTAGYPDGWNVHTVAFVIMFGFNTLAVLSMVNLTNRVMAQNTERGQMIAELAETNSRLRASMDENAGLHEQLLIQAREAGVLAERQRLAGEIHDTLAQGFAGIITQLEAARQARSDPGEWSRHLELADSLARENLTEARRSVRALRPEQLEEATLPEALAELARGWSARSRVPAGVETTGTPVRAGADVETAVFRVAQEALSNVAKHAGASAVHLTLTYMEDLVLIDVADDGVGFEAGAAPGDGCYGLTGMRRRVESLAGSLTVESTPGDGTTVNAAIPLPAPAPVPTCRPPRPGAPPILPVASGGWPAARMGS